MVIMPRLETIRIEKLLPEVDILFLRLEENATVFSSDELTTRTSCLINFLICVLYKAEQGNWSREKMRDSLPNTCRIHNLSSFVRYVRDWPRGFPGDFMAINMIVDRVEKATPGTLGEAIGRYIFNSPVTQQYREKLMIQVESVRGICRNFDSPRIISLACGSCRDLEQVIFELKQSHAKVMLIDFDQNALDEAKERLYEISDQVEIFLTDIRKLPKLFKELLDRNGKFHLIYAGGLFDYLSYGIIKLILKRLAKDFIHDDGTLMFTNIKKGNPYRLWMGTMGDCTLIERSEAEMIELLNLTGYPVQSLTVDPTGLTWIAKASNSVK